METDNGAGRTTVIERSDAEVEALLAPRKPKVSKILWTLNLEGKYSPEITKLTYPLLDHYARKIGAEFKVISERRWPDFPPAYEKLQIHELGRGAEWNIFMDSDTLVHTDFFD